MRPVAGELATGRYVLTKTGPRERGMEAVASSSRGGTGRDPTSSPLRPGAYQNNGANSSAAMVPPISMWSAGQAGPVRLASSEPLPTGDRPPNLLAEEKRNGSASETYKIAREVLAESLRPIS